MTELPEKPKQNLHDLLEEANKALRKSEKGAEGEPALNLLNIKGSSNRDKQSGDPAKPDKADGTFERASYETKGKESQGKPSEKTKEPALPERAQKKTDDSSVLSTVGGFLGGVGDSVVDLVVDTKKLFFNADDAKIRRAALSGGTSSGAGLDFLSSMSKSGSELSRSLGQIVAHPVDTFGLLKSQISAEYDQGSSYDKAHMWGKGVGFAGTLLLGTGLTFKGLGRFGKAEEVVGAARVLGETRQTSMAARLVAEGKLGTLGQESRALRAVDSVGLAASADRFSFLSGGKAMVGVGGDTAQASKLETTVQGLKGGLERSFLTRTPFGLELELGNGQRIVTANLREAQLVEANLLKPMEAAASRYRLAGNAVTRDQSMQDLLAAAKGYHKALEGAGLEPTRLSQLMIADERAFGEHVTRQLLHESPRGISLFGGGTSTELRGLFPTQKAVAEADEAGRLLFKPMKVAREVLNAERGTTSGTTVSGVAARSESQLLTKEVKAVEEAARAVTTAQSDAAFQVASRELRAAVGQYNKVIETNPLTKAISAELTITDQALGQFEGAGLRLGKVARSPQVDLLSADALSCDRALVQMEHRGQVLTHTLDDARAFAGSLKLEDARLIEQKALDVEQSINRVKLAESAAAREQAIVDLRQSAKGYNQFVEEFSATTSRAQEFKLADSALGQFEMTVRDASKVRTAAGLEIAESNLALHMQDFATPVNNAVRASEGLAGSAKLEAQASNLTAKLEEAAKAATSVEREKALSELGLQTRAYNNLVETQFASTGRAAELKVSDEALAAVETAIREKNYASKLAKTESTVTEAVVKMESSGKEISLSVERAQTACDTMGSAEKSGAVAAVQASASQVQSALSIAQAAKSPGDVQWALEELRTTIRAYNDAVLSSPLAPRLVVSEGTIGKFETLVQESSRARRLAEVETSINGDYITKMAGRRDLLFGGDQDILKPGSLSARVDGLTEAGKPGGSVGEGLRRLEQLTQENGGAIFRDGGLVKGLTGGRAMDWAARAAGMYIVGRDMYLAADRTIERLARAAKDSGDEGAKQANTQTPAHTQVSASNSAANTSSSNAVKGAEQSVEKENAKSMGKASGEALSPAVQAFRASNIPTVATSAESTQQYLERKKEEEIKEKKKLDQFGRHTFNTHVYLKGAEPTPETEAGAMLPVSTPIRRVGAIEPDVPRIVTPSFKPHVVYTTQSELFGTISRGSGEGKMVSAVGAASSRKGKGASYYDEDKLIKQYPFLVHAAGDAGIISGSKNVFRLVGVEGQERKSIERASGGSSSNNSQGASAALASAVSSQTISIQSDDEQSNSNDPTVSV